MFANEPQQQPEKQFSTSDALTLVFVACHIWALPIDLVLRHRFGSRYIDGYLFLAALWPMCFAALLFPEYSIAWTWWAFWIVVVLGAYHRLLAVRLDRKGVLRHSQYNGYPILCEVLPLKERAVKGGVEFLLLIIAGMLSAAISPSLMIFLIGGGIAAAVKEVLRQMYQENELIGLRDARIEQESLAERVREDR